MAQVATGRRTAKLDQSARIDRELKQLRAQLAALEEKRAALLSELGEQGPPRQ